MMLGDLISPCSHLENLRPYACISRSSLRLASQDGRVNLLHNKQQNRFKEIYSWYLQKHPLLFHPEPLFSSSTTAPP